MCPKWVCIISCVLLAGLAGNASAGVVFFTQVTAASNSAQGCVYAINGSGLTGDLHDNSYFTLWMTAVDSNGGGYTNPHPGTYNPGSGAWTWIKFDFDDVYHLGELWVWNYNEYTGRGFRNVVIEYTSDGTTWKKLGDYVFAQAPGTTNYAHNTAIDFNGVEANSVVITTKKGVGVGNWGDGDYGGLFGLSEVRFYYVQGSNASEPKPVKGAISMPLDTTLSWTAGLGAQSHNVYFGTTSPGTFQGNQTATTFNPGSLAAVTTYYWRIDEINGANTVTGNVWSFTTSSGVGLALKLNRGITLDRQFTHIPPEGIMTILPADIKIIKSMGFEFVKLLVNPACFISGSTINDSNMWYLDEIVNRVLNEGLPVVVCIHPMPEFKYNYLGTSGGFTNLLGFYRDFAAYMTARWDSNELAFQLMTEPFDNYQSWNTMQPQMWQAVRSTMPAHTLILSGDQAGQISGLINVAPVNDDNVYYCFTYYEPWIFTTQGASFNGGWWPYLGDVPYPSSPSIVAAAMPTILANIPDQYKTDVQNQMNTYGNQYWCKARQQTAMQQVVNWNASHGGNLNVWCAEFGVLDPVEGGRYGGGVIPSLRLQFIQDLREVMEEDRIGWAYWSYNETFTVLNPNLKAAFSKSPSYDWIDNPTLDALGLPLCGCGCKVQPSSPSDLDKDCYVNISDLAMFASTWADCTELNDPSCSP